MGGCFVTSANMGVGPGFLRQQTRQDEHTGTTNSCSLLIAQHGGGTGTDFI